MISATVWCGGGTSRRDAMRRFAARALSPIYPQSFGATVTPFALFRSRVENAVPWAFRIV
jgi:hypothetical protein